MIINTFMYLKTNYFFMNKILFLLITIITLNLNANNFIYFNDSTDQYSGLNVSLNDTMQSYIINIENNSDNDTFYLFNSYLKDGLENAKYLKRFDKKNKQCKISFLPLITYLTTDRTDNLILGENRIINRAQVLFSFQKVLPKTNYVIQLNKQIFNNLYYNDFNVYQLTIFNGINFKHQKKIINKNKIIELAIYRKINFCKDEAVLINDLCFYKNVFKFKLIKLKVSD